MSFSNLAVHDDQIRRMREWAVGQGHHPDTYRRRPPRAPFSKQDPRSRH
jgi:hypothetical protein